MLSDCDCNAKTGEVLKSCVTMHDFNFLIARCLVSIFQTVQSNKHAANFFLPFQNNEAILRLIYRVHDFFTDIVSKFKHTCS